MCARDKLRHSIDDHLGNNIYDNVYVHRYNDVYVHSHDDVNNYVFYVYSSGTGAHDVDVHIVDNDVYVLDGFSDDDFHIGNHYDQFHVGDYDDELHIRNHDDQFHFGNYDDGVYASRSAGEGRYRASQPPGRSMVSALGLLG